jgi:leucyl aminopeptidase
MKNIILILITLTVQMLCAQEADKYSTIKLYVDKNQISLDHKGSLEDKEIDRLYQRISQIVNQENITEIGYSNFLVCPKLEIISNSVDNVGTTRVFMTECELFITIKRLNIERVEGLGTANFNTISKKIIGSGFTKAEAFSNVFSNIRKSDKELKKFFEESKKIIDDYYMEHCKDVIEEANQAKKLKNYVKAISLYFSVPKKSPCDKIAYDSALNVYTTYVDDRCQKQVALMKTYAVLAQNEKSESKKYYDSIVTIIKEISPSANVCYAEAKKIMEKIEKNLNENQKQDWELEKIKLLDEKEIEKERYKAIQSINKNYVPPSTVIITK